MKSFETLLKSANKQLNADNWEAALITAEEAVEAGTDDAQWDSALFIKAEALYCLDRAEKEALPLYRKLKKSELLGDSEIKVCKSRIKE